MGWGQLFDRTFVQEETFVLFSGWCSQRWTMVNLWNHHPGGHPGGLQEPLARPIKFQRASKHWSAIGTLLVLCGWSTLFCWLLYQSKSLILLSKASLAAHPKNNPGMQDRLHLFVLHASGSVDCASQTWHYVFKQIGREFFHSLRLSKTFHQSTLQKSSDAAQLVHLPYGRVSWM